jgi:hypothetical protein
MIEYAQANVEVAWIERGSTGTVHEREAVFLIEGTEDMSDEEFIARAEDLAEATTRTFIEVLDSALQDRYLTTPLSAQIDTRS